MSNQTVSLSITLSQANLDEITEKACSLGAKISAPVPANNASNSLNAPVTGAEVLIAAQVVTCIFATVAAAAQFLAALKDMKKSEKAPIIVINLKNNDKTEITDSLNEVEFLEVDEE